MKRIASASTRRRRPTSDVPRPRIAFTTSVAWIVPRRPGRTPRTPPSAHDGTVAGGGGSGKDAAVARPLRGVEDGRLPFETEDRGPDVRLSQEDAGVVDEVAGREVVGPVGDDVVGGEDLERVRGRQPAVVGHDVHVRVERRAAAPAAASSFGRPTSAVP